MPQKERILLLEDDQKLTREITEVLPDVEIVNSEKSSDFMQNITALNPAALLIDFDLREKDGLLVYRDVRQKHPDKKTIMFSSSNSIPLAVAATKLGVFDFLRKPLDPQSLLDAVKKVLKKDEPVEINFSKYDGSEWLLGCGAIRNKLISNCKTLSSINEDIALYYEAGTNAELLAQIIHDCSPYSEKKFVSINLSAFDSEMSESHLFLTLKELIVQSEGEEKKDKKDIPGTLFLNKFEKLNESVRLSLIAFIKEKRGRMRAVLGIADKKLKLNIKSLDIPSLSQRKEDLPVIAMEYINRYVPKIKLISPDVIEFFAYYDFPGNYAELENMIKSAGFQNGETLTLKNLPINAASLNNAIKNKLISEEKFDLKVLRQEFEKVWFNAVLKKVNNDANQASRFLDMPKNVFVERLDSIGT